VLQVTNPLPYGQAVNVPTLYYSSQFNGKQSATLTWTNGLSSMFGFPCGTETDVDDYQVAMNYTCVPSGVSAYVGTPMSPAPTGTGVYSVNITDFVVTALQYNNGTNWNGFGLTLYSGSPDCVVNLGSSWYALSYTTNSNIRCGSALQNGGTFVGFALTLLALVFVQV